MRKLLYLLLALPLLFVACNEDEIMTFDSDDAGIYFQTGVQTRFYLNIDEYWDSVYYSFSEDPDDVKEHVLSARLRTMGKVRDYDRKVRVVVDEANSTAIRGTHYTADLENVVITAGASEVEVPVTFLRHPELLTKQLSLMLKVEDNENFKVPFTRQKYTNVYYASGDTIMADRFLFVVNEFYSEPALWTMFGSACGKWSIKKQRLMSELFELSAYDWSIDGWRNGDGKVLPMRFTYFAIKMRIYLQAMADAGTPVREDDGSFMQLGAGYEVDYSNCM